MQDGSEQLPKTLWGIARPRLAVRASLCSSAHRDPSETRRSPAAGRLFNPSPLLTAFPILAHLRIPPFSSPDPISYYESFRVLSATFSSRFRYPPPFVFEQSCTRWPCIPFASRRCFWSTGPRFSEARVRPRRRVLHPDPLFQLFTEYSPQTSLPHSPSTRTAPLNVQ